MPLPNRLITYTCVSTVWSDPACPSRCCTVSPRTRRPGAGRGLPPCKIGRETLVVEAEWPIGGRSMRVAVKQYRPRKVGKALAAIFRPAKAIAKLAARPSSCFRGHYHPAAAGWPAGPAACRLRHHIPGHAVDRRRGESARLWLANRCHCRSPRDSASPRDVAKRWAGCSDESMPQAPPIAI